MSMSSPQFSSHTLLAGNGLHHLVEAATALTQLGPSFSSKAPYNQSTESSKPVPSFVPPTTKVHSETKGSVLPLTESNSRIVSNDVNASSRSRIPQTPSTSTLTPSAVSQSNSKTTSANSKTTSGSKSDKEIFPIRLHSLLADPTVVDVISWLPHGRSFVVLRPDIFATCVLPRYFAPEGSNSPNAKNGLKTKDPSGATSQPSQSVHKYPSFTRKLNRWGFRQISRGVDAGAFRHELFRRDDRELCRSMVCQKSRKPSGHRGSKSNNSAPQSDDAESVASYLSKASTSSGTKRPYAATVSVNAAEVSVGSPSVGNESSVIPASKASLPPKKRRSMPPVNVVDAIPVMMSRQQGRHSTSPLHRAVPQDVQYKGNRSSVYSVAESELTSNSSETSVCSSTFVTKSPNVLSPVLAAPSPATQPQQLRSHSPQLTSQLKMEAAAKATLAHNFHQQQRKLALASLMENSQLAMIAAGVPNCKIPLLPSQQNSSPASLPRTTPGCVVGPLAATANPSVVALTVSPIVLKTQLPSLATTSPALTTAQAAKNALYQAYVQALSGP